MSLRRKVLVGLFWSGGARVVIQAINWGITVVVVRILSPSDYGLLAMATIFSSVIIAIAGAGIGAALIQAPQLDDEKIRRIFGAIIVLHGTLFLIQYAVAGPIASFFDEERLVPILRVGAFSLLISILSVIPYSLLTRALDFKTESIIGVASNLVVGLATLGLALHGWGVWALVIGNLIGQLINVVAINVVAPFSRWPSFSFREMRGLLVFGGNVTGARLLWLMYSQADIFIAGRLLGKELLGVYSVAMHLASLPVQKISAVLNTIAFPAFAQLQHDRSAVSQYILKVVRVLSFVAIPILWGISSIAPEIVTTLLGAKWEAAVVPLCLLPLVMPINMISSLLGSAFQGIGESGVVFRNVLTAALVMPIAFWIGVHWELLGLCLAWIIGFPIVMALNLRRMLPLVRLRARDLLGAVGPTAMTGAGMYAAVSITRYVSADSLEALLRMALLVAVGGLTYLLLSWFFNRSVILELADLFGFKRRIH